MKVRIMQLTKTVFVDRCTCVRTAFINPNEKKTKKRKRPVNEKAEALDTIRVS